MLGNLFGSLLPKKRKIWFEADVNRLVQQGLLDEAVVAANALADETPQRDLLRGCLIAEIAFRRGKDDEAEAGFKAVLAESPGFAHAHYGLSLLYMEKRDLDAALRHAKFADASKPHEGRFLAQLGLCHVRLRNYAAAERHLRAALLLASDDKSSWNNLGIVLVAKQEHESARQCFEKALSLDASFENARRNLETLRVEQASMAVDDSVLSETRGSTPSTPDAAAEWAPAWDLVMQHQQEGAYESAASQAEDLLVRWPDDSALVRQVAKLYGAQGDMEGALSLLEAFLVGKPHCREVILSLGLACMDAQQYQRAEQHLAEAIRLGDTSSDTWVSLGETLHKLERYEESVTAFQRALDGADTFQSATYQKLAAAQVMACDYAAAMESYQKLLDVYGEARNPSAGGLTLCLTYVGEFERALRLLDKLLAYSPADAALRAQRAQIHLLFEDYEKGWEDYRYRGLTDSKQFRVLPVPQWDGESLADKTIIVLAEQGLGDQVMFASCLPDLLNLRPRKVYLEAVRRVAPTLARSFPDCEVIPTKQDRKLEWVATIKDADLYIPLGDLPYYFRKSRSAFPQCAYLRSDPARVLHWRAELARRGPPPYIGVSWRGGTATTRAPIRSFPPSTLTPLTHVVDATWINLQYGSAEDGIAAFSADGKALHHWPEAISDLDEFAALISALDGVVTACNTTVHYAGALGRPVWILAPKIPEWRYGISYDSMPWYPDVHVYRQPDVDDWEGVVQKIASDLQAKFAAPREK